MTKPLTDEVIDKAVEVYVEAVNYHLGNMSEKEWESDRKDKHAHLRRVARVGLVAAAKVIESAVAGDRRDADRYRFLRDCKSDELYVMAFDPEGDAPSCGGAILDNDIDQRIAAIKGKSHDA